MFDAPISPRVVRFAAVALLLVTALLVGPAGGAQAQEPATGQPVVRLAHLSPDTPEVDIYVTLPDSQEEELVLADVAYAQASDYYTVDPGFYEFVMRPAGAAPTAAGVLTLSAEVETGRAYTFAALGSNADLQRTILIDSLEPPPDGQTKVRFIQAASGLERADITAVGGPVVASSVAFASSTDYAAVPAGSWTLQVAETGKDEVVTETDADLQSGDVVSLVLADAPDGGVELTTLVDAAGAQVIPVGPIPTGGDGPEPAGQGWWAAALVAAGVWLLAPLRRRLA